MKRTIKIIAASALMIFCLYGFMPALNLESGAIIDGVASSGTGLDVNYPGNEAELNFQAARSMDLKGLSIDSSPLTKVPEPATMVLFGIGLIGLAGIGRRKIRK